MAARTAPGASSTSTRKRLRRLHTAGLAGWRSTASISTPSASAGRLPRSRIEACANVGPTANGFRRFARAAFSAPSRRSAGFPLEAWLSASSVRLFDFAGSAASAATATSTAPPAASAARRLGLTAGGDAAPLGGGVAASTPRKIRVKTITPGISQSQSIHRCTEAASSAASSATANPRSRPGPRARVTLIAAAPSRASAPSASTAPIRPVSESSSSGTLWAFRTWSVLSR